MFNLKEMAREAKEVNLESHEGGQDAVTAFADGYDAGMMEAQVESGFEVLAEANDDMNTIMEARAIVDGNLESGTVTDGLREAYMKTMLRVEGKYGVDGLADANLESADAVKGFLKKLAANAAMIISKLAATAKKVWLSFSAWLATSDDKVKSLITKLEKVKSDGKVLQIKGEERARTFFERSVKYDVAHKATGKEDVLKKLVENDEVKFDVKQAEDAIKSIVDVDNATVKGAIDVTAKLGNIEFDNEKVAYLAKQKGTKGYICGLSTSSVTLLLVNPEFTPENYDGDAFTEYKVVTLKREVDIEETIDAAVKAAGLDKEDAVKVLEAKDLDEHIAVLKGLPKGKELQKLIKTGFGELDKAAKTVEKTFGKPDEWADKGKQAVAKKDAYVAASKAVFSIVKSAIGEYKIALTHVSGIATLPAVSK